MPYQFNEEKFCIMFGNAVNEYAKYIHENNVAKGFWPENKNERNIGEALMLITAEVAEALEGNRKPHPDKYLPHRDNFEVELADAVIRIFDLAAGLNLDIGGAIIEKTEFNKTRPHKHGKAY